MVLLLVVCFSSKNCHETLVCANYIYFDTLASLKLMSDRCSDLENFFFQDSCCLDFLAFFFFFFFFCLFVAYFLEFYYFICPGNFLVAERGIIQ